MQQLLVLKFNSAVKSDCRAREELKSGGTLVSTLTGKLLRVVTFQRVFTGDFQ